MVMRSVRIQTVPSSVVNRNLSLVNLTKLFKVLSSEGRQLCLLSNLLCRKTLREREEILEREGKTERHSSSLFETLYSSHHLMAEVVD